MEPLTLPGTLDSLASVGQYVLDAAKAAGLDKKTAYGLRLAVDEIATNVITHGYVEATCEGALHLQAVIDAAALTTLLEDTGATYVHGEVSEPTALHLPLEERAIGGLGVYLAVQNVDKFLYEQLDGRNRHTFVMYRM
jgi:anti-sigma regulatory factor (Ser/Thr protein kinase)